MKRSELIRQLMEAHPEGDPEVVVHKSDVWFIDRDAEFYDGATQIITKRAENGFPLAGEYRNSTNLIINIWTRPFSDCIWDDADFEVDYSRLSERDQAYTKKYHDSIRESVREIERQGNKRRFLEWVKDRFPIKDKGFLDEAEEFFIKNLNGTERKYSWDDCVIYDEGEGELKLERKEIS